jgi:hypothetical protein
MIISVGNDQLTWMYEMGIGVPRAIGGIQACIPDIHPGVQICYAGSTRIAAAVTIQRSTSSN